MTIHISPIAMLITMAILVLLIVFRKHSREVLEFFGGFLALLVAVMVVTAIFLLWR